MLQQKNKVHMGVALLVLTSMIWGSGFIFSKMSLEAGASTELFMVMRFGIATLVMGIGFFGKLRKTMKRSDLKPTISVGVFLYTAFYVQVIALQYTTPANSAFLTATYVLMVPFIWWGIKKKPPQLRIFVAAVLCIVGIAILSFKEGDGLTMGIGDILSLVCALLFSGQIIATGVAAEKTNTVVIVFMQFLVSAVLSLIVFFATGSSFAPLANPVALLSLLYLAFFSTCLCYFLQTYAQKYVDSSKAAIILGTEALFGSVFSVMAGYDALTMAMVIGGSIIMIALILTEWQPRAFRKSNKVPKAEQA